MGRVRDNIRKNSKNSTMSKNSRISRIAREMAEIKSNKMTHRSPAERKSQLLKTMEGVIGIFSRKAANAK